MARSSRRPRRAARAGTLRLLLVLSVLVGVNVYFLGFRGGTSIGALLRSTRVRAPIATMDVQSGKASPKLTPLPEDPPGARLIEGVLADGQTVAQALTPSVGRRL